LVINNLKYHYFRQLKAIIFTERKMYTFLDNWKCWANIYLKIHRREVIEMADNKMVNGVNVTELFNTIEAIKDKPDIAKFKFRATNKWINGTHCRATIKDFYGALKEDNSRLPVDYDMDEPPVLLGNNEGRNPVEYLLVALSGCLTTSLVAHASAKGIKIQDTVLPVKHNVACNSGQRVSPISGCQR
jgi:organic hydroperoxide reductase OsmC/OhrA